jgi:Flp pilus assembly protein TadG
LWSRIRRLAASGDAGSSTAELALATPVLMGILLFLVLCGRLVSAQMDLDAAAGAAARSGSIARNETTARAEAERTARQTLAARGVTCRNPPCP